MWKDSIRNKVVTFQTNILRIVGFYVRHSAYVTHTPLQNILIFLQTLHDSYYSEIFTVLFHSPFPKEVKKCFKEAKQFTTTTAPSLFTCRQYIGRAALLLNGWPTDSIFVYRINLALKASCLGLVMNNNCFIKPSHKMPMEPCIRLTYSKPSQPKSPFSTKVSSFLLKNAKKKSCCGQRISHSALCCLLFSPIADGWIRGAVNRKAWKNPGLTII